MMTRGRAEMATFASTTFFFFFLLFVQRFQPYLLQTGFERVHPALGGNADI